VKIPNPGKTSVGGTEVMNLKEVSLKLYRREVGSEEE